MGTLIWATGWLLVFFLCLFVAGVVLIGLVWSFLHLGAWVFRTKPADSIGGKPADPTQN